MTDPTPMIALASAVFLIYYLIVAVILYLLIPRSKYEYSILNNFIDSCILIISLFPSSWLLLKTFHLL